ncbi:MFS transporter, partial [Rhodococcus aetherivorans]
LTTAPEFRGRVMALYMAIFMGGTPIGAPIVGWVANAYGPRWAIGVGAAAGFAAALTGLIWMIAHQHLRVAVQAHGSPRFVVTHDGDGRSVDALETMPIVLPEDFAVEREQLKDEIVIDEVENRR